MPGTFAAGCATYAVRKCAYDRHGIRSVAQGNKATGAATKIPKPSIEGGLVSRMNDVEASLAANFLVHFLEQRIPSNRLSRLSARDLLDLYRDTLTLVKGDLEPREFDKKWFEA